PRQQDQRQQEDERERVREAAEQRMEEVAVGSRDAGHRAVRPLKTCVRAVDDVLNTGSGAVDPREALNERVRPTLPTRWRGSPDDSWHCAQLRCDLLRVA